MKEKYYSAVLDDETTAFLSFEKIPAITGPWDFKKFVKINDEVIVGVRTVKYDNAILEIWNGKGQYLGRGGIVLIDKPQVKPLTQCTPVMCNGGVY